LSAICAELPAFADNKAWLNERFETLANLTVLRNTIVHGYCHGISDTAEPTIHFRAARFLQKGVESDDLYATQRDLEVFLNDLLTIDFNLLTIFLVVNQESDKARRNAEAKNTQ